MSVCRLFNRRSPLQAVLSAASKHAQSGRDLGPAAHFPWLLGAVVNSSLLTCLRLANLVQPPYCPMDPVGNALYQLRRFAEVKNRYCLISSLSFSGGTHEDRNRSRPIVVTCVRTGGPADR